MIRLKAWPVFAILMMQGILLAGHWFILSTFLAFWPVLPFSIAADVRVVVLFMSFSFVVASLLSFRFSNYPVRGLYRVAAVWLGFANFFFWASILIRLSWVALHFAHLSADPLTLRRLLAAFFYTLAVLAGLYGLINARAIRVRKIAVQIPGLPATWRGRRAVVMSDLHLGPINGARFSRRMVALARKFEPSVVFIPGDLFDGTHVDLDRVLVPFQQLKPPLGVYFSTGNHEEFTAATHYLQAIARAGICVLANQSVEIEGLLVAGVLYRDSAHIIRMKAFLEGLHLDGTKPCILLNHAPVRLPIVEQAGVKLQLSGHTHGGQIFPFTWMTRRIFGRFTSGLSRFGSLQVFTSTGAGTWGPPMRIGSAPEMVVLTFV